jgi:hypothetical protein
MEDVIKDIRVSLGKLSGELENFQEIAKYLKPTSGEAPQLKGLDIYGESMPLNGLVGGDHIIYVDFKKRYDLEPGLSRPKRMGINILPRN